MVGREETRVMNLAGVLHTCSHSGVAEAALFSMGGTVAAKVFAAAERRGVPRGALVAELVSEFERDAPPSVRAAATCAMRDSEQPIPAALQFILVYSLVPRRPPNGDDELVDAGPSGEAAAPDFEFAA
jgi:hypothetical protein